MLVIGPPCRWRQQESHNNRDYYFKTRASLTPPVADTVLSGVYRAHLTCYTSPDTVALGVDRAHVADAGVSVTDGVDSAYVSSSVHTDRAAASDATGLSTLPAITSINRAAASDASGFGYPPCSKCQQQGCGV